MIDSIVSLNKKASSSSSSPLQKRMATSIKMSPPTPPPLASPSQTFQQKQQKYFSSSFNDEKQNLIAYGIRPSKNSKRLYESRYEDPKGLRGTTLTELKQTSIRMKGSPSPKREKLFFKEEINEEEVCVFIKK